ncbi:hypothetical protein KKB10_03005 [Patescibacteria group bacterium]|nr:hypothetical protein [Patescibacteria group bacterium]MBU1075055.1 hypothetical protein [Patescibacteria group bacterium]MBU1952149.1 hypothetical protein [Patescibacteria group bacterium]
MSRLITCAFIGGTGMGTLFGDLGFKTGGHRSIKTPYGDEVMYTIVRRGDLAFVAIDRHYSTGNFRQADQLDHRAYMYALWKVNQFFPSVFNIQYIFSTSAVGGLHNTRHVQDGLELGDIVVPHDVKDFTRGVWSYSVKDRYVHPTAFHRSANGLFCRHLQQLLQENEQVKFGGVLACAITGPLYETPVEIVEFTRHGIFNLLGMQTVTPEAYYARQNSMHLAVACVVTDTPDVEHDVDGEEVARIMNLRKPLLADLFVTAMLDVQDMAGFKCSCTKKLPVFHEDLAGDPADVMGMPVD